MIFPAPNAAEERAGVLHERVRDLRKSSHVSAHDAQPLLDRWQSGWRTQSVLLSVVFFVLTCVGIAALNGLLAVFFDDARGVLALLLCLGAAEWMIRRLRIFNSGVEVALVGGAFVSFITSLPSEGKPEALLVFALAGALTAWRTHSAAPATAAVLLSYAYVAVKFESAGFLIFATGAAVATIAALALMVEWRRPWVERFFIVTLIAMIPATWIAIKFRTDQWEPGKAPLHGAVLLASAALLLAGGLTRRHHALLLAGLTATILGAIELWPRVHGPDEAKLLASGIALLGGSLLASRLLRHREHGVIVTPVRLTAIDDSLLAAAGAVVSGAAAPSTPSHPVEAPVGAGGRMGGAGSTGEW